MRGSVKGNLFCNNLFTSPQLFFNRKKEKAYTEIEKQAVDQKLHPCAFFSHHLSPAERNYDIGNREVLAVKLALEE